MGKDVRCWADNLCWIYTVKSPGYFKISRKELPYEEIDSEVLKKKIRMGSQIAEYLSMTACEVTF